MHPENCLFYYQSSEHQLIIIIVEGLSHQWRLVQTLTPDTYIYNQIPWNLKKPHLQQIISLWSELEIVKTRQFNPFQQIIWLMNTFQQVKWATELGLSALLVNHNCWLDENLFQITNHKTEQLPYDAVINSRPYSWKRVYLADKIDNLAYIQGQDYTKGQQWSWSPYYRTYQWINLEPIKDPREVVKILNKSKMGLILSGCTFVEDGQNIDNNGDLQGNNLQGDFEGACYSSSEYLLCGLPVISTQSEGGRDLWYQSNNSIICQPSKDGVYQAFQQMLTKINNGQIDRHQIRQQHIELQWKMRDTFIQSTGQLFQRYQIDIDAKQYFLAHFRHKMVKY